MSFESETVGLCSKVCKSAVFCSVCHFGLQEGVFGYSALKLNAAQDRSYNPCIFHSSPQRLPTLNPGGSGCLLVHSEWAALSVLLHPAPPRPPSHTAERHGSAKRRVLWQRAETAEGGVWLGRRDSRPASQLMSEWLMWLTHLSIGRLIEPLTRASQLTGKKNQTIVPKSSHQIRLW